MPTSEPAQTIVYCGASSQKYLSDARARGTSCTSSKMIRVSFGSIFLPEKSSRPAISPLGSNYAEKSSSILVFESKLT